ncbi:uncharacterized protein MEPE_04645 [Melanopsichium pennsylvanicum]|uniref:Sm domain-containing protein n=1 Tax=Melanopsichium pennsylvanicum TaxID=63383 RepID=A0AAJ5C6K5_9BASI|nr:uncharacterized protein MEPE_04645 [Melanopsichium pennsylvanicum]
MDRNAQEAADMASATIEANFVGRTCIVHIPDGRAFCGTFVCVDSGRNIILAETEESRVSIEGRTSTRSVGMVMIPGNHVIKVEVQQNGSQGPSPTQHSSLGQAGRSDDDNMYS